MSINRFSWQVRPVALPENMITGEQYRFTVLTPCLIRMEYASDGYFEDRASQTAFYRDFPQCKFSLEILGETLILQTDSLQLTYEVNRVFTEETLKIKLRNEPASTWRYGEAFEDLGGTTRTLDGINGACALERGIISRNGFSVLDDSNTLVLEQDGWIGVRQENTVDCYFFGYGYDYIQAVQDLYRLTGMPPLLPAYALGNWWSRYHAYTQEEYIDLIDRFQEEDVPLSVGVVDMDWHVVKIPEALKDEDPEFQSGWTGYTWNEELFPDYKAFLSCLKQRNLHTALNLHPAQGVCRHEAMYRQMAEASGIDPASGRRIPLDILSQKHMENYFDVLHHPYEEAGVDFWWMDWQQGTDYWWIHQRNKPGEYQDPRERVDPLWMLNHLHILDISRNGKRPMFFSRYAGLGSHRYPVGFSGDTFATWDSLRFQPYFTACASNVGYSWWSHDIGGHMDGCRDDELATRWIQFGVFSPINRLHSTCSEFMSKEPWHYGYEEQAVMKKWLRLRHSLFPYLYTMNYRNHTQGIPLIVPMYYSHPKCQDAYQVPNQYWFGSELIVAPITEKRDPASKMGRVMAWLPKGDWFDFFTGLHYSSNQGRKMELYRDLWTIPVLAKAGAIVPMAKYEEYENRLSNAENMQVVVFPGADGSFCLYEDKGEYHDYQKGAFARTEMHLNWEKGEFSIFPANGDTSLIPEERTWSICLRGFQKSTEIYVNIPGATVTAQPADNTIIVQVHAPVTQHIQLRFNGTQRIHDNSDVLDRCKDILMHSQICNNEKTIIFRKLKELAVLYDVMFNLSIRVGEASGLMGAFRELLTLTEA